MESQRCTLRMLVLATFSNKKRRNNLNVLQRGSGETHTGLKQGGLTGCFKESISDQLPDGFPTKLMSLRRTALAHPVCLRRTDASSPLCDRSAAHHLGIEMGISDPSGPKLRDKQRWRLGETLLGGGFQFSVSLDLRKVHQTAT